ncbi:MAG: HNH endonuclease [Myxococcales bacterium]
MSSLDRVVAAHPLRKYKPYNAIKFVRVDGNGTPLYRVGKDKKEQGPASALRLAFERFGANCFHCEDWMLPGSDECTLDHLRPKKDDGEGLLHNLVFACRRCNHKKGANDLVSFQAEVGAKYLKALDEHLIRCLNKLGGK